MKKRFISFAVFLIFIFTMFSGVFTTKVEASEEYAWVLVDTYNYPIADGFSDEGYFGSLSGNMIEIKSSWPYGLGAYASKDYNNPTNMHAKYTWTNPPSIIKPNEKVNIKFSQEVISNRNGNYSIGYSGFMKLDAADLKLGEGTGSSVNAKAYYEDGSLANKLGIGYKHDDRAQSSFTADLKLEFRGTGSIGSKTALYIGVNGGSPGVICVRYTYEWKNIGTTTTSSAPQTPTVDLGKYGWEGEWDTNWGKMILTQNGATITGTYTHDSGKINGTISGNILRGTWSESPTYSAPNDAGDCEITMASDGKSFTGKWRYGSEGNWGIWDGGKRLTPVVLAPTTSNTNNQNKADSFESGARIMWSPVSGLGYRLFRSTSQGELGISVTDFYITSTSFADVNVEPNTTYFYIVKPVLAEANPYQGMPERLGDNIATFTVRTGSNVKTTGKFKHFIILKLNSPNMSVDGLTQEVDPGRGTAPITISNRTMVPIRAIVEAMGGTVSWDGNTKKITLKARGNTVEMWLDKTTIIVNGVSKKMDVAPVSKNGRTYVPVRFGAENLNCSVDWINSTKEAVVVYEE